MVIKGVQVSDWKQVETAVRSGNRDPKVGKHQMGNYRFQAEPWFRGPQAPFLHANKWVERTPLAK